jgi:hypothetical protein
MMLWMRILGYRIVCRVSILRLRPRQHLPIRLLQVQRGRRHPCQRGRFRPIVSMVTWAQYRRLQMKMTTWRHDSPMQGHLNRVNPEPLTISEVPISSIIKMCIPYPSTDDIIRGFTRTTQLVVLRIQVDISIGVGSKLTAIAPASKCPVSSVGCVFKLHAYILGPRFELIRQFLYRIVQNVDLNI